MSEAYDVMLEQPLLPRQQPFEVAESFSDETIIHTDDLPDSSREMLDSVKFSEDALKMYYQKIGRIPLLNAEQEVDLSKWIEAGVYARQKLHEADEEMSDEERYELEHVERIGEAARKTMIESNLRLVVSEARQHMGRGVPMGDLIQEANIGLMHAVELFDYTKGYKFSTYAIWWIRRELSRAIDTQAELIYKPTILAAQVRKVRGMDRESIALSGRPVSDEELMNRLQTTRDKAKLWRELSKPVLSLDYPLEEGGDDTFGSIMEDVSLISPENYAMHSSMLQALNNCLSLLSEREVRILKMRYGFGGQAPMTLDQTSKVFSVSRQRIRQIEFRAIKRIKTAVDEGKIPNPFSDAI